jgi:hypothetical protein
MPIYDRISEKDYQMYQRGWKPLPRGFSRFEAIEPQSHPDSYHPDPTIFVHDMGCPHKSNDYLYAKLPEGYINHKTEQCVDMRMFRHDSQCPHSRERRIEAAFIDFLKDYGTPAYIGREWDDHDLDGTPRHVEVLHCPLCDRAGQQQCAFAYCNHGKPFHGYIDILMQKDPRNGPTSECVPVHPNHPFVGCTWAGWCVCMHRGPQWSMITYEGCVLGEYERNMSDDSDFYAVVWDEEAKCVSHEEWGSTRFACSSGCVVDATEETKMKAYRYCLSWATQEALNISAAEAHRFQIGKEVRVIKAVKRASDFRNNVPQGMTGIITQVQDGDYGMRIQFVDADVNAGIAEDRFKHYHWVSAGNLEIVNPANYMIDWSEAVQHGQSVADSIRAQNRWRIIGYTAVPGIVCAL